MKYGDSVPLSGWIHDRSLVEWSGAWHQMVLRLTLPPTHNRPETKEQISSGDTKRTLFGNISPKGQRTEQSGNGKSISLFKILSYCTEIVLADSSKPGTVTCLSGSRGNSFEGWYNEFCRIYLSLIDMVLIRSQFQRHCRSGETDWTQSP